MRKERWIAPFLLAGAVAACDALPTPPAAPDPGDELAAAVRALGFESDEMKVWGEYVVVEGDILLDRAMLASAARRPSGPLAPRFQYHTAELVSLPRIYDVTVDVSEMHAHPAWQEAVRAAMAEWSAVPGSYIRMREGAPGSSIKVTPLCFDTNEGRKVAAWSTFPVSGGPGPVIQVNTCFEGFLTGGKMTAHMIHELGHTIGFLHSDTGASEFGGGVHVSGTPTGGGDPASVMNTSFTSLTLSDYDRIAARRMYPLPPPQVSVVSSGGYPLISWTLPPGATGQYTVRLLHNRYDRYGRLPPETVNEESTLTSGSGTASWLDMAHPFTGTSSCSTMTTSYTRKEAWLYEVIIQYPNGASGATASAPVGSC